MLEILEVPTIFQPDAPFPYPGHQQGPMIEQYAHDYFLTHGDEITLEQPWTYVPVYWTNYACVLSSLPRWKRRLHRRRLAAFLKRTLRPGVRYFTISQHDDGLSERGELTPPQPILQFSAGGTGDVPMPLLCDLHEPVTRPRDIRASFVGALTNPQCEYPARAEMARALRGRSEYQVVDVAAEWGCADGAALAERTRRFVELMCRSVFALCPRGYGKTSFRLYEAMHLGCIPVYLYDEPWLPFADVLDWNEFCILVHVSETAGLHEILSSKTDAEIAAMQRRIRAVKEEYFTLAGTMRQVSRCLNQNVTWSERVA